MRNGMHTKFILTPIFEILEDCINATKGIGDGIGSYPLCEYIMQTTFLKMTGANEQKLKCVLWELATNDFEFRYEFLKPQSNYGECSSIKDKQKVFKALIKEINKLSCESDIIKNLFNDNVKDIIKNKVTKEICDLLKDSIIAKWQEKRFLLFTKEFNNFLTTSSFCNYNEKDGNLNLIEQSLNFENIVYQHRNRCAHNLTSYQTNLPLLSVLIDKDYDYQNYFFRFSILILIDEIFMKTYKTYLDLLEKNI